ELVQHWLLDHEIELWVSCEHLYCVSAEHIQLVKPLLARLEDSYIDKLRKLYKCAPDEEPSDRPIFDNVMKRRGYPAFPECELCAHETNLYRMDYDQSESEVKGGEGVVQAP